MVVRLDILRTRRLACAWRCAGVQEAGNLENGPYVVPAWLSHRLALGAISRGGGVRSKDYVCKDAVQGLGRGWAAVCGAAGLGCFAVMAQSWTNCVGVVELSAAAVQGCMRRD